MFDRDLTVSRLYNTVSPSWVGFQKIMDDLMTVHQHPHTTKYPPYNIRKVDEDGFKYIVEYALAGWASDEVTVTQTADKLTVSGEKKSDDSKDADNTYDYKGISGRSFEQTLRLADQLKVTNANMKDGLLVVEVERIVPEAERPRLIEIKS